MCTTVAWIRHRHAHPRRRGLTWAGTSAGRVPRVVDAAVTDCITRDARYQEMPYDNIPSQKYRDTGVLRYFLTSSVCPSRSLLRYFLQLSLVTQDTVSLLSSSEVSVSTSNTAAILFSTTYKGNDVRKVMNQKLGIVSPLR